MKIISILVLLSLLFTFPAAAYPVYDNAIQESSIPKGTLIQAKNAINSGTLKIAFVGDSITEGGDQTSDDDIYVNRIKKYLTDSLPNVNVQVFNFSIGGTGIRSTVDTTFVCAGTDPLNPTNNTFMRTWCVPNQPWLVPVKSFAPDLVIVAFGMNDSHAGEENTSNNLRFLTDQLKSWAKPPSIVLTSNMQPTSNQAIFGNDLGMPMRVARSTREFAKENKFPLADVSRTFQILRDGFDDVTRVSSQELGWTDYATRWTGSTNYFSIISTSLVPNSGTSGKWITRSREFYNGVFESSVTPVADGWNGAAWINYRDNAVLGTLRLIVVPGTTGSVNIYSNDAPTPMAAANANIPVNSATRIKLEVNGIYHKVYVNGELKISLTTYKKLHNGSISLGSGSGLNSGFSDIAITYMDTVKTTPTYTDEQIMGKYNSPESGNGLNHPSGLGQVEAYFPSFYGILKELTR